MDFLYSILILMGTLGAFLLVWAGFSKDKNGNAQKWDITELVNLPQYNELSNKMRVMDATMSEADTVLAELNDVSKNVFKEIDDKYQELLFLYNLIEDKKKKNAEMPRSEAVFEAVPQVKTTGNKHDDSSNKSKSARKSEGVQQISAGAIAAIYKNPKLAEILDLSESGLSVAEIAKKLKLGKGEVELILSLDKKAKN